MSHPLEDVNTDWVFDATAAPLLVVDDSLVIRAVNRPYLAATARGRDDLLGREFSEAFPDNPRDRSADGVENLTASFRAVFRHGRHHRMALQRHDMRGTSPEDGFVRRFWTTVNSPMHDAEGRVVAALHHREDVTGVLEPVLADAEAPSASLDERSWDQLVGTLAHEALAHRQTLAQTDQLSQALTSRIVIEQAKGVVRATWRIDADEAFDTLRQWARSSNLTLHAVCAEVVATLQLPPPAVRDTPGQAGR